MSCHRFAVALLIILLSSAAVRAQTLGYYRQPALNGEFIVFVSEGDLWKVPRGGGRATRLTSHVGDEGHPAFSPDGRTLAFTGQNEGSSEVYVVPITGGRPQRLTYGLPSPFGMPRKRGYFATDSLSSNRTKPRRAPEGIEWTYPRPCM